MDAIPEGVPDCIVSEFTPTEMCRLQTRGEDVLGQRSIRLATRWWNLYHQAMFGTRPSINANRSWETEEFGLPAATILCNLLSRLLFKGGGFLFL